MGLTKHAVIRYHTLDRLLSNHFDLKTFENLHEEVNAALQEYDGTSGIEVRQLRADLAFMKSKEGYSAPIEAFRQEGKYKYRYTDKSFSIRNTGVNGTEAIVFGEAVRFLSSFKGRPGFELLDEFIPVLEDKLGIEELNNHFISYGDNKHYKGYELITPLFTAIKDQKVLKVEYQPYGKDSFCLTFHPHYLKNYNNRYFVFGFNSDEKVEAWNMPLDRIVSIENISETYISSNINWEEYFEDIVGVTKTSNEVVKVVIKVSDTRLPYIITKPLHESQVVHKDNEGLLSLKVIINPELKQLLLSFGADIEVIEPASLREEVLGETQKILEKYS